MKRIVYAFEGGRSSRVVEGAIVAMENERNPKSHLWPLSPLQWSKTTLKGKLIPKCNLDIALRYLNFGRVMIL